MNNLEQNEKLKEGKSMLTILNLSQLSFMVFPFLG